MRVAFVCVQNAGRSQMATAFAEREQERRSAETQIDIVTGGTRPADRVHPEVVAVMEEVGFDLSDRTPRGVTPEELDGVDYVITMGCAASDVCPATWHGENRDWGLDDPGEQPLDEVRRIRDEIEGRVESLFDEMLLSTDAEVDVPSE